MKLAVAGTGYVGWCGRLLCRKGSYGHLRDVTSRKLPECAAESHPSTKLGSKSCSKRTSRQTACSLPPTMPRICGRGRHLIGVGTPELADGSANLSYIAAVCREIAESVTHDCLVVVKSTVPVGTNDKVEHISRITSSGRESPRGEQSEFLAQGNRCTTPCTPRASSSAPRTRKPSGRCLKSTRRSTCPSFRFPRRSAEMIKYACNNFLALKIFI